MKRLIVTLEVKMELDPGLTSYDRLALADRLTNDTRRFLEKRDEADFRSISSAIDWNEE